MGASNCPSYTLCPEGHILCIKGLKNILFGLIFNHETQNSTLNPLCEVPTARMSQVGSNEKVTIDSPRERSCHPQVQTFDVRYSSTKEYYTTKNNYWSSCSSNPMSFSFSFFSRKNMFSLSKTTPFGLKKKKKPFFLFSSPTIVVTAVTTVVGNCCAEVVDHCSSSLAEDCATVAVDRCFSHLPFVVVRAAVGDRSVPPLIDHCFSPSLATAGDRVAARIRLIVDLSNTRPNDAADLGSTRPDAIADLGDT